MRTRANDYYDAVRSRKGDRIGRAGAADVPVAGARRGTADRPRETTGKRRR
ncbi:hypothetical protein BN903_2 [Halorubrum sp. AJ67]|nr:hypothetical protein BN903_2 [Halorubrum sp. AJ67]